MTEVQTSPFDGVPVKHMLASVRAGNFDSVMQLIPKVGIDCSDEIGCTPLEAAARAGLYDMALFLLEKGASLKKGNDFGRPLHWFAAQGWLDLVTLCLDCAEDPFSDGKQHKSAFVVAAHSKQIGVLNLLARMGKESGRLTGNHLVEALNGCQSTEVAQMLVELGLPHDVLLEGDEIPLYTLVRLGNANACHEHISRGADANHRAQGYSPLYYAVLYDRAEVLLTLLQAGASEEQINPARQSLSEALTDPGKSVKAAYATWTARLALTRASRRGASNAISRQQ